MGRIALCLLLLVAACSSAQKTPDPTPAATTYTVENYQYLPLSVKTSESIKLVNNDDEGHTFTLDDGSVDVRFDPGDPKTVDAPSKAGEYPFHCTNHPSMKSTLTVT